MHVNVAIHPSWLGRPEELGRRLAALTLLERTAPPGREPGDDDEPYPPSQVAGDGWRVAGTDQADGFSPATHHPSPATHDYPERQAPARSGRGPGHRDDSEGSPPTDGRQLLGWAGKQVPDMKGPIIGWGKKKGLHSKIVEWTPQQVAEAYRFARRQSTTR